LCNYTYVVRHTYSYNPSIISYVILLFIYVFFFIVTPTIEIYTLSLHDALPISSSDAKNISTTAKLVGDEWVINGEKYYISGAGEDRKSTRLNSSHVKISYAVFCLKKKTKTIIKYHYKKQD